MMAGLLVMSIVSGQVISRTGRYRIFPIVGTALMAIGLLLLSRLDVGTSTAASALYLLILGLGLGSVMQVLVLAVQNAVDYERPGSGDVRRDAVPRDRRVAGGSRVRGDLHVAPDVGAAGGCSRGSLAREVSSGGRLSSDQLAQLPASTRSAYEHAYVHALSPVFVAAAGVALLGFALSWLLPRAPAARDRRDQHRPGRQPGRAAIARLPRRDRASPRAAQPRPSNAGGSASEWPRAPISISARGQPGPSCASTSTDSPAPAPSPTQDRVPPERIAAVVDELRRRGLIAGEDGGPTLTSAGHSLAGRAVAARRELLDRGARGRHRRPRSGA